MKVREGGGGIMDESGHGVASGRDVMVGKSVEKEKWEWLDVKLSIIICIADCDQAKGQE